MKDKVVWITGASSGIGEALALALAEAGAYVVISARRAEKLAEVKAQAADPERIKVLPLDLGKLDTLDGAAEEALAWRGHLDGLVNNAGISQRARALEADIAVVERIMRINFLAPVALTRAVVPSMVTRGQGRIVNVSSVAGYVATPMRSTYSASKGALQNYFNALRAELHGSGVSVTNICPGYVATSISANALTHDGSPKQTNDADVLAGISPEACANKIISQGLVKGRREVYVGGKEIMAIYLQRFFPGLVARFIHRAAPS